MKTNHLALVILLCVSSVSLSQEEVTLAKISIFGGNGNSFTQTSELHFKVAIERLLATPIWDGSSKVPVSVDQALETAKRHFKTKHPEAKFVLDELELNHEEIGSQQEKRWFYKVELQGESEPEGDLNFVILMDKSIVTPQAVKK